MIKFTFLFIIFYWLQLKQRDPKAVNRYITMCSILFIIMMGLRNEAIYGDTLKYVEYFKELNQYTFNYIFIRFEKDSFFWVVSFYLSKLFNGNYTIWLSLIAVSFMLPITKMIRRYSLEPMYSWIVFVFLGFMIFVMAGLRQTVAMSLTLTGFLILLDETRVKKKRRLWFVCCVILASLFHGSALICLLGLFFYKRSFNKATLLLYMVTLVSGMILGTTVLNEVASFAGQYDERYLGYAENMYGASYGYLIQQLLIVLPTLYFLRNNWRNTFVKTLLHFSILGFLFVSLSPFIAEMFRVSYYFSWSNIILFPMAVKAMRREISFAPAAFLFIIIVYLVFISGTVMQNHYFWFENTNSIIKEMYQNVSV